ncbi:kinase-like protein [Thelephora ganbajun]|uniref:Kinase-like protein n=1 Tax=Thelephora ganbajun TaxID=370292 RepID=A0ACB6ZH36_THEGA|nr:kinase-like protein [Thelephora ganbajun]
MVSEWMGNGNINQFIERDRHVNRTVLLVDVASGLKYLHDLRIVHGDLKGANILINKDRRACIANFGITAITGVVTHAAARSSQAPSSLMPFTRWMSPELLDLERFGMPQSEDNRPTRQSDCYALGMVIYEVLCGHHPYVEIQPDFLVIDATLEGVRPKKPEGATRLGFTKGLWRILESCWLEDRNARPSVKNILPCLNDAAAHWHMGVSLTAPTIFPRSRVAMFDAGLPEIDFILLGNENLVRLGEDFVRALPFINQDPPRSRTEEGWINAISEVVSKAGTSPASLSPQDAMALAETFHRAVQLLHLSNSSTQDLWIRLHVHALLRGLPVFPNVELWDGSLDYDPLGFVDIWKGNLHGDSVCIKVIRTRNKAHLKKIKQIFYHEVEGRKHFSHPNVLPILQVSKTLLPLYIMSPWMPGGNILQYTQKNPNVNWLMLLAEVCHGLSYLHGQDISHGCIAPGNILITQDGRACLGDFGISGGFSDLSFTRFKLGTARYMALGQVSLLNSSPSKQGDVYSLAMTSFTVLTGVLPYDGVRGHYSLKHRIQSGERPPRPTNSDSTRWLRDSVWDMITTCWSEDPNQQWEVPAMYNLFSTLSLQEVQKVKSGIEAGRRQRGRTLPRIISLTQSLPEPEPEIERRIDEMDERLESYTIPDRERVKLINELCKTCSRHRVIPTSIHIPDFSEDATQIRYAGGFSTVSQSMYEGHRVAVKVVCGVSLRNMDAIRSRFCREVVAWKHLRHSNILPLLGVTVSENQFMMVSEWMENGNINEFIGRDRYANRTALLVDVANGLKYMHDLHIVHGDLKGANILINEDRRACIADFSLTTITDARTQADTRSPQSSLFSTDTLMSFISGGTYRWMSPELLDPEQFGTSQSEGNRPTRQSDCYALGMVIYEVLCGHHPYIEIEPVSLVVIAIAKGDRPKKPEGAAHLGFSNELWMTVEQCWRENRDERPKVDDILGCLNEAMAFWYMREF